MVWIGLMVLFSDISPWKPCIFQSLHHQKTPAAASRCPVIQRLRRWGVAGRRSWTARRFLAAENGGTLNTSKWNIYIYILNYTISNYIILNLQIYCVEPRLLWGYAFVSSLLKIILTKGNWLRVSLSCQVFSWYCLGIFVSLFCSCFF